MTAFALLIFFSAAPFFVFSNALEVVKSLPGVPPAALAAGNHFSGYVSIAPPATILSLISIDTAIDLIFSRIIMFTFGLALDAIFPQLYFLRLAFDVAIFRSSLPLMASFESSPITFVRQILQHRCWYG